MDENSGTDMDGDQQEDEILAWRDLMKLKLRKRYSSSLTDSSISVQVSLSPDLEEVSSNSCVPYTLVDSATDSGQTSDTDSRSFDPDRGQRPAVNPRKQLIENLLHEIYGPDDEVFSEELEETRNLVRRSSDASQGSSISRKSSVAIDYTAWRIQYCAELSRTLQSLGYQGNDRLDAPILKQLDTTALRNLLTSYESTIFVVSRYLVQELKRRDNRQITHSKQCLIMSAALQALTPERGEKQKLRFSITPPPGDGYFQWIEAMRAVLRLPGGLPSAFRKTMWITIASRYISQLPFEWDKVKKLLLHDRFNPDEEALGIQIVKDLHRTGCSGFCGEHNEKERNLLKRVLLAYARFRPSVGYCQGFNIIAAVILDVVDKDEEEALKIMIYLIEHVLPANYFAHDLEALTVDLSVFQELILKYVPNLSSHLDKLRKQSLEERGANGGHEPPLTNLFTIQWFLTLFATCLQQEATLRVWDCVFLYGSVILMKTALALLIKLEKYFLPMGTAFDFYSIMSELQVRLVEGTLFTPEEIILEIFNVPEFDLRVLRVQHALLASRQPRLANPFRAEAAQPDPRLRTGLVSRRMFSSLEHRRSSAADAETDISHLKKKYDAYIQESQRASPQLAFSRRRGSIFLSPDASPDGSGHGREMFTFSGQLLEVPAESAETQSSSRRSSRGEYRTLNSV